MSKVTAHDNGSDDDEEQSIEDDLKALQEMDIDKDYNVWSDFRNSFSVSKRENLCNLSPSSRPVGSSSIGTSYGSISECKEDQDQSDQGFAGEQ